LSSTISAYVGIYAQQNATVINAGVIESSHGAPGVALVFGGGTNRLILDPGASFVGTVSGGGSVVAEGTLTIGTAYGFGTTTLELASAISAGTVTGLGGTITNFASLSFDAGAQWTVSGNDSASGLGTIAISGFALGDTIDLTGFVAVSASYASGVLTLTDAGAAEATLQIVGSFGANEFQIAADAGMGAAAGTDIFLCFAEATHIATPTGMKRIEELKIGDLVTTYFGGSVPIEWIGRRHVDCARHPHPSNAWPVRIAANSFGSGCPYRDLFLSPNHAVHVLGDLIPVRCLINGTSIVQVPVDEITYYHVELAQHDMLWAEGLLAESYLDTGDRANFFDSAGPVRLFPDFATPSIDTARFWETKGCLPLVVHGHRLEAARKWIGDQGGQYVVLAA
jgi:hypothetical protein